MFIRDSFVSKKCLCVCFIPVCVFVCFNLVFLFLCDLFFCVFFLVLFLCVCVFGSISSGFPSIQWISGRCFVD